MSGKVLVLVGLVWLIAPRTGHAWNPFETRNADVEQGNAALEAGDSKSALEAYDRAARKHPREPGVHLGRGLALLSLGQLDQAREAFRIAAEPPAPADLRASAHHNAGLTFFREAEGAAAKENHREAQRLFREAADAFRRSLRARPGYRDAAWNLELAKRRIREEEEAKKKQEEEQKDSSEDEKQNPEDDPAREEKNEGNEGNQGDEKTSDGANEGSPNPQDERAPSEPPKSSPEGSDPSKQGESPPSQEPAPDQRTDGSNEKDGPRENEDRSSRGADQPSGPSRELPSEVSKVLDALERSEDSFQKHRGRVRARRENRRPVKDW